MTAAKKAESKKSPKPPKVDPKDQRIADLEAEVEALESQVAWYQKRAH